MNQGYKDLKGYQLAFNLAKTIFEISKSFPKEERYSLTDQIRRSSRSTCANIAEGYRKRIYPKHFKSKMTDADGEASETQVWIDFALNCKYIDEETHQNLTSKYPEVGKMLGHMIKYPKKYSPKK